MIVVIMVMIMMMMMKTLMMVLMTHHGFQSVAEVKALHCEGQGEVSDALVEQLQSHP